MRMRSKNALCYNVPDSYCGMSQLSILNMLGHNPGNLLYQVTLLETLKVEPVDIYKDIDYSEFKSIIVPYLCFIQSSTSVKNLEYLNDLLNRTEKYNISIIPISFGIITDDEDERNFQFMDKETGTLFNRVAERCVSVGCRGESTARILNRLGIKNTKVIGCPSVYHPFLTRGLKRIDKGGNAVNAIANAINLKYLNEARMNFMDYIASLRIPFIEQTPSFSIEDSAVPRNHLFYKAQNYLSNYSKVFYRLDQWEIFLRQFNFSLGMRFHGNVLALWNNIPALFVTFDNRMRDFCGFFKLPYIKDVEFDREKPIEYYYELANYEAFNNEIPNKIDEYCGFLRENGLEISGGGYYESNMSPIRYQSSLENGGYRLTNNCAKRVGDSWIFDSGIWCHINRGRTDFFCLKQSAQMKWLSLRLFGELRANRKYNYSICAEFKSDSVIRVLVGNSRTKESQQVFSVSTGNHEKSGCFVPEADGFDVLLVTSTDFLGENAFVIFNEIDIVEAEHTGIY